jgi:hypothetical protein
MLNQRLAEHYGIAGVTGPDIRRVLLAPGSHRGGFKHGQHLAFDPKNNRPLANLFVTMLQRMGIEADKFASSTGTMTGVEV